MSSDCTIGRLCAGEVEGVARLHVSELDYSFNSRLGCVHMASIYRALNDLAGSYIIVARMKGEIVGVVSGVLDAGAARKKILSAIGLSGSVKIALRTIVCPFAWWALYAESKDFFLPEVQGHTVSASLSALVVSRSMRRQGIAKALVQELERYFSEQKVAGYCLGTPPENVGAQKFYQSLDFVEMHRSAVRVTYYKSINRETH